MFREKEELYERISTNDQERDRGKGKWNKELHCGVDLEPLRILKRKAYKIKMETSGPKEKWRSKMD